MNAVSATPIQSEMRRILNPFTDTHDLKLMYFSTLTLEDGSTFEAVTASEEATQEIINTWLVAPAPDPMDIRKSMQVYTQTPNSTRFHNALSDLLTDFWKAEKEEATGMLPDAVAIQYQERLIDLLRKHTTIDPDHHDGDGWTDGMEWTADFFVSAAYTKDAWDKKWLSQWIADFERLGKMPISTPEGAPYVSKLTLVQILDLVEAWTACTVKSEYDDFHNRVYAAFDDEHLAGCFMTDLEFSEAHGYMSLGWIATYVSC